MISFKKQDRLTYPDDGIQLRHCNLLCSINCGGNLLLMLFIIQQEEEDVANVQFTWKKAGNPFI